MRINSLQVHPTPMWTSTLRGCQATPVSHCVKLKHNHPRPSPPSYEPGNPPPPASPLSIRHSFHFLLSISLPPPLFIGLLSFSLFLFRAVGYPIFPSLPTDPIPYNFLSSFSHFPHFCYFFFPSRCFFFSSFFSFSFSFLPPPPLP